MAMLCCVLDERQKVYSFICSNLPPPAEEREEAAARAGTTAREGDQKTLLFWVCYKPASESK